MLLCDTGSDSASDFDDLVVFASQARAVGLPVAIHRRSLPESLSEAARYDIAPFVTEVRGEDVDRLILLGTERVTDDRLRHLRSLCGGRKMESVAFGRFETQQQRLGSAARLSYALGIEPDLHETPDIPGLSQCIAPVFQAPVPQKQRRKPTLAVFFPDVECPASLAGIRALSLSRTFDVIVISQGKNKPRWLDLLNHEVPVWHPGEILPRALAARIDIAVLCEAPMKWYRFQSILANLTGRGAVIIDGTAERHWSMLPEGVIAGTHDFPTLFSWLQQDILPVADAISREVRQSELAKRFAVPDVLLRLGAGSGLASKFRPAEEEGGQVVFMPTNGVGLGHAKRCSLIATALERPDKAVFAAFPSCLGLLNTCGLDAMPLVSRDALRKNNDNDLVNHGRLNALSRNASGLVFDGGYVFDSVLRSIADNALPSVWIRRGLWQDTQNNGISLDRQKIFDRIVVPREAFDELNASTPRSERVVEVGPIVQQIQHTADDRDRLRASVQRRLGHEAGTLVVTMLGGGVAADRRAQINAVCTHLSTKKDVLNLLVVWPTAVVDPAWFAHKNTAVVQSCHASALIAASDLFISAVGYNSFHEALYGGVATIFLPQMASFMDDQRARAQAASERDLALLVEPWETLRLSQAIDECLEGRAEDLRGRLRQLNLPEPGTKAAARAVEEICT